MKKFLSVIMALTIMLVPFQVNAFAMSDLEYEDYIEFVKINKSVEKQKSLKKRVRRAAVISVMATVACIWVMNKYSSHGEFGSALGKNTANAMDFTKDQWDKVNNFVESTPWLNSMVEKIADTYCVTKENMLTNFNSFICSYHRCGDILCKVLYKCN